MYELKKNGKVLTSKFVGTGPSSYEKRIYRAAVSQRLRNSALGCTKEMNSGRKKWVWHVSSGRETVAIAVFKAKNHTRKKVF